MVPEKKLNILEKFIIFSETNTKIVKVYSNLYFILQIIIYVYQFLISDFQLWNCYYKFSNCTISN